jgi:hypothetical protein
MDESDVPGLEKLNDDQLVTLEPADLPKLKKHYSMLTDSALSKITAEMEAHGGKLHGFSTGLRRHENISVEIWAENPQVKNELYELCRLFIGGALTDYLETEFGGDKDSNPETYGLTIFDDSLHGERSNNYNTDFSVTLAGGQLTFGVDYFLEQTVIDTELIDTELVDGGIDIMEVINHVRGSKETTRSVVFDDSAGSAGGTGTGNEEDGGGD